MKWISCFFLTFFLVNSISAQDSAIKLFGKVVNGSRSIINVSILNTANGTGTITDAYGEFELKVQAGDVINFSCIGFKGISL
jgi:hypothetical protein